MRILLAHKISRVAGGADFFFRETERVLREAGHDTLMVAADVAYEGMPGNLVLLDAPKYDDGSAWSRAAHLPAAIYDRRKRARFDRLIDEFKPDLLHIFGINVHLSLSPITAAANAGLPIVATFNDYKHICPNYKLFAGGEICYACKGRRFYQATLKNCCKGSRGLSAASTLEAYVHRAMGLYEKIDHFTFSSDFMARRTQEFWPERPLNWSKLRNPFASAEHAASEGFEPFGLYFGRIIGEKGVDRIIDAAKDIRGYPIKIVGDGPDEPALRERVRREGVSNVEFLGPKWGAELDPILSRAAFVIVPSLWHENFPYVINQAFAFGRPVIGSRRGGITELVEHGRRGLIFEPDSAGELARSILELSSDPERIRAMGHAAKLWSDANFNDETALRDVLHAYERGIDASRRRRR